ncbi:MAG: Rieske 2Fe-2S domain-containing protein [Candidatus Rokubacteria bacterium]|nr:Rieske 2Fe-2S domain-containing protein [Candidatus Rokubacteria bacterium]
MNKIEQIKGERDGLDVGNDIPRYAGLGVESIEEENLERLKWWGVFFRRHTPGFFMMRIRIPNGITNSAQLRAIGWITKTFGRGIADITTRQQIQLRWVRINDVPAILDRLLEVGLVTLQTGMDNIRNVVGCPVAGLTPNELFDAAPVARAFTAMFVGSKTYTNLPRKFNVTITGCRENCTHTETQDIALIPATKELADQKVNGFNVLVGGKNGSGGYRIASPLDLFVRPEEAAEVCSAIVLLFRDHGFREARNKARLAFLLDDWGEQKFRDALAARLGRRFSRAGVDERVPKATDHVGIFRQKQGGLNYVGLLVPVGRVTGEQLPEVARLADAYGTGEIRLTTGQNLIIPHVPDAKIGDLLRESLLKVLRYEPSEVFRGLVSCTGIEFCNLAVIETKARALGIAKTLEPKLPNGKPISIHWSGCPAGCGNHTVADIGLLGVKTKVDGEVVDAVDVFIGGSSGPHATQGIRVMENVPCDGLPQVLEGLIRYGEFEKVRGQLRTLQPMPPVPQASAPKEAAGVKPLIRLEELWEGAAKVVRVNGTEAALFNCQGRLYAVQNLCPHEGAALSEGVVDGEEVICPLHAYRFNLRTGACTTDPNVRARTFRLIFSRDGFTIEE